MGCRALASLADTTSDSKGIKMIGKCNNKIITGLLIILISGLAVCLSAAMPAAADSEPLPAGELVVEVPADRCPVFYTDDDDQVVGIGTDLMRIAAEALCRWDHVERGWIPPSVFIPALEDAGIIYDLDCYVWEQVCKDLSRWSREGKRVIASVNLSRADFGKQKDLPGHFRELVTKYGLPPEQLHIEITETAYVDNPELLITTTDKFREYGFQVEMDDFGSGYSSLNMLKEVQVDRIKLDLHFLTETGDAEKGQIIIQHMIQMAQSLGIDLIAEGVERREQAQSLYKLGCTEMQGYYYYKTMPAAEYEQLTNAENAP